MKFEHVDFNEKFWIGKSRAEFLKHEGHHKLSVDQLNEVYDLINPKKLKATEEKKISSREPDDESLPVVEKQSD